MKENRCLKPGNNAPDFTLKDQNNNVFTLSQFKGKRILLSFHPLAWTPVCTKQMQSLEKHIGRFQDLNTIPIGISVDTVPSKKAWAEEIGIKNIHLLSDFWPHGGVAQLYGLFREKEGFSERANIVIGEDHTIEYIRIYEISELPDIQDILTFLKTPFD